MGSIISHKRLAPVDEAKRRFGSAVRKQRLMMNMSQESLAERAQLHRTYITDVEAGRRNLSLESIIKLAQGLGIPIAALFHHVDHAQLAALEAPKGKRVAKQPGFLEGGSQEMLARFPVSRRHNAD